METAANGLAGRIQDLLRERLQVEVDDPKADLFESGLIDSLLVVELLVLLEAEFGVQVPMERLELDDFRSLERIAALIE